MAWSGLCARNVLTYNGPDCKHTAARSPRPGFTRTCQRKLADHISWNYLQRPPRDHPLCYGAIYRHRDIPRQEESFRLRRSREIALLPRCEGERRPERRHRKVLFIASKSLHLRVELNNSAVGSGPWCQPCSLIESDDRCKGCLATPCLCRWDIRLLPDSRASSGKFIGQKVRVAR